MQLNWELGLLFRDAGLHPLLVNPLNDTSDPALLVRNDGTVGIGTSNPTETLEVVGSVKADDANLNLEVSGDVNLGDVLKVDQVGGGNCTTNPEIDLQVINTVTGAGVSIGTLVTTSSQLTLESKSEIQIRSK